jgi:hypothetical protein
VTIIVPIHCTCSETIYAWGFKAIKNTSRAKSSLHGPIASHVLLYGPEIFIYDCECLDCLLPHQSLRITLMMKRKLNADDVPEVSLPMNPTPASSTAHNTMVADNSKSLENLQSSWDALRLDSRINQAIQKLEWSKPTPIQEQTIPLVLQGKDILGMKIKSS